MMTLIAQAAQTTSRAAETILDNAEAVEVTSLTQVIAPYMGIFFAAFIVAILATPLMRMLAVRNGIVDLPDLKRKNHIEPVAYLGGVAIFLGWVIAIALAYYLVPDHRGLKLTWGNPLIMIMLGAGAITLTGFFDDVYGISPRVKIGGQLFAAAALAHYSVGTQLIGLVFSILGLDALHIGAWDALPTISYIVGTVLVAALVIGGCNSMNLIDGLDGLASGVAVIAGIGFLCIAAVVAMRDPNMMKDPVRIAVCLAMIGAVLGFLPYNFNPASIFMGDTGSLLLGYLCMSSILLFADSEGRSLLLVTAGLIVFAVPITDTSLAIFRRKMQGKPIFSPDSQHIHHLLRRSGLSVKKSVGVIYLFAAMFSALGYTMVSLELRWRYVLAVFFVLYGFIVVTAYKYGRQYAILHPADGPKREEKVLPEAINGEDDTAKPMSSATDETADKPDAHAGAHQS